MADTDILVACLCAQWCGTCREYAPAFAQLGARLAPVRFVWVDVEDACELVDPVEVENFPTLLIAAGDAPRFFGALAPQPQLLERIVRDCASGGGDPSLAARDDLRALVQRVRTLA